jgi:proteasome lid subunit RPN8/RPN11
MRVSLPPDHVRKLRKALKQSGKREIGGQLFGKQVAPSNFEVTDLTLQFRRGSFARFVVDVLQATRDALRFFDKTGHHYREYNYIGEWHSHPSFAVSPSAQDAATMRDLVSDHDFKGTFAVLMIVRLDDSYLQARAWLFDPRGSEQVVQLEIENGE